MRDGDYPEFDPPLDREDYWAIGLFEGEGCLTISGTQARAKLNSTDEDVVRRFARIVGVGQVREENGQIKFGYKPQWEWFTGSQQDVSRFVLRYFHVFSARRQERALEILDHLNNRPGAKID